MVSQAAVSAHIGGMNFSSVAQLGEGPLGLGIIAITFGVAMACIVAQFDVMFAVRGTRRRYRAATIVRTLLLPAVVLTGLRAIIDYSAGNWFSAVLNTLMSISFLKDWGKEDEDNWWSGRGTKIKKTIASLLTRSASVSARAGA